ncbi:hypothetical protein EJP69_22885 [Variovorax gossypii]|uniref:Uncharacterized protein n=1 Tax=Variovorax gossypii TaxID=1679495 RepID=A0A3S0GYI4_9BURK|nr:hypothetical protein [Variovorax gossypii]RTQ32123.1 hypothetical protein EJP69_22885 [Variovorax gossypii]
MTGSWLQSGRAALAALLLTPMLSVAENGFGTNSATARLRFTVIVPPVFRVLQVTPTADGYDYLIWTNMKSVMIGGREYRFTRLGENTVRVPTAPGDTWVVHGL